MVEQERFGRYALERLLGSGGMGQVWVAYDPATRRRVALKVLAPQHALDPEFRRRFLNEAEVAAGLQEPHVIPIHQFGEIDGRLYIDMALIDGTDVETMIRGAGRLDPHQVVDIVTQAAVALDAAHQVGLVHRDVKPSNLFVHTSGFIYLIDFGIAHSHGRTRITDDGSALGTLAYMAPERFSGGDIGPLVDVYALGCVLYEGFSGRTPYAGGDVAALVHAHLHRPPPQLSAVVPTLSPAMDAVVARALAKDPAARYATAGDLARAAQAALDTPLAPRVHPTDGPPPDLAPDLAPARRRSHRRTALVSILAAGLLAVGGLGTYQLTSRGDGAPVAGPTSSTTDPASGEPSGGATACAGGASITGAGSSLQQPAMQSFIATYQTSCPAQSVTYTAVGAGAGRVDFADGRTDFGASETPITGPQAAAAQARCGGNPVWNLPLVFTPITLSYNVTGVPRLVLDGPTAAAIFKGQVRNWNDEMIADLNPGSALPDQQVTVVYRSDQAGVTDAFQQYLTAASGGRWNDGTGGSFKGGTGVGVEQASGVAERVAATPGAITYLEQRASTAQGLTAASITSGSGAVELSPLSAGKAIESAAEALQAPGDLTLNLTTLHGSTTAGSYPLLAPTYFVVCSKGYDAATSAAVKSFLSSIVNEGQTGLSATGFVPLPSPMKSKLHQSINAIG